MPLRGACCLPGSFDVRSHGYVGSKSEGTMADSCWLAGSWWRLLCWSFVKLPVAVLGRCAKSLPGRKFSGVNDFTCNRATVLAPRLRVCISRKRRGFAPDVCRTEPAGHRSWRGFHFGQPDSDGRFPAGLVMRPNGSAQSRQPSAAAGLQR